MSLVPGELACNPDVNERLAAHPDLTPGRCAGLTFYAKAMTTGEEVSPQPPEWGFDLPRDPI